MYAIKIVKILNLFFVYLNFLLPSCFPPFCAPPHWAKLVRQWLDVHLKNSWVDVVDRLCGQLEALILPMWFFLWDGWKTKCTKQCQPILVNWGQSWPMFLKHFRPTQLPPYQEDCRSWLIMPVDTLSFNQLITFSCIYRFSSDMLNYSIKINVFWKKLVCLNWKLLIIYYKDNHVWFVLSVSSFT